MRGEGHIREVFRVGRVRKMRQGVWEGVRERRVVQGKVGRKEGRDEELNRMERGLSMDKGGSVARWRVVEGGT